VLALLYAAPVWTVAPRTYLNRLQIIQNKFLCTIFNAQIDTRIADLHREAELESVDQIIAKMLSNTYKLDHDNPLIRNTGNYNIEEIP